MGRVASDTLSTSPYYYREYFWQGLSSLGYQVAQPPKANPEPGDVLVTWNRNRHNDEHAKRYERAGARVIIAENGYVGRDNNDHILFAMALSHHAGAGTWKEGPEDRWAPLGIEMQPWRTKGKEIVILPQRGIGEPGIAMPQGWAEDVANRLRQQTSRPVRIRPHPGKDKTDPGPDLKNAWAAVTWASGAGIKAILAGVPVFHEMPTWIGGLAARYGINDVENPYLGDRIPMLRRLAWSQWTLEEVRRGDPFRWLLESHK